MKIKYVKATQASTFADLQVGDVFECDGDICIKAPQGMTNAFNVSENVSAYVNGTETVIPLEAELVIKGEKHAEDQ